MQKDYSAKDWLKSDFSWLKTIGICLAAIGLLMLVLNRHSPECQWQPGCGIEKILPAKK
jgi:hypothetical protein